MAANISYLAQMSIAGGGAQAAGSNDDDNIWGQILQEVSSKSSHTTPGSVIILGDDRSGKTSLVNRMKKSERNSCASLLEYDFLTVQAERDGSYAYQLGSTAAFGPSEAINLPVWTLDGKTEFAHHLTFAFPSQLSKCAIVLAASLTNPGNILPSLRKWYRMVDEQIRAHYDKSAIEEGKQAQIRFWQEYVEPVESSMHANLENASAGLEIDAVLPPEPNVLVENCGAPVIVVITKTDTFNDLSDEQLNKVQYHVRQFCLHHGAALIYTSAKSDRNTQLLFKYLAHRVYSLAFTTPAYIVDKESIFVPSGWDSEQKLDIIKETLSDLDVPPLPQEERVSAREPIVEVEDEQAFLKRMEAALAAASVETTTASPKREPAAGKMGTPQMGDSNSTLSSFFSNLIKNKDSPGPKSAAAHVDPQAHFQKLLSTTSKQPMTSTPLPKTASGEARRDDLPRVLDFEEDDGELSPMGSTPRDPNDSENAEP